MSQSFNLAGPAHTTTVQFNGADCSKIMLNGVRIWERYTATQQVWVSSGYNQSGWVFYQTRYQAGSTITLQANYTAIWKWDYVQFSSSVGYNTTLHYYGGAKYTRGGVRSSFRGRNGRIYYHYINKYNYQTTWVDTSSYQTQSYTAYYA